MDFVQLKLRLYEACVSSQMRLMENARTVMQESQDSANEYGAPQDRYDSYRTQLLKRRDMFAAQYHKAQEDLKILQLIDPARQMDKVGFGAVVITNDQKLYVGLGIGKLEVDGEMWYSISPQVPFFAVIKGLKKGDTFEFRGKKNKIIEVF
jgi:hypothetical protein